MESLLIVMFTNFRAIFEVNSFLFCICQQKTIVWQLNSQTVFNSIHTVLYFRTPLLTIILLNLLGNFYRIKYALSYGAQTLEEILMLPDENMGLRIENFFVTTLERNGKGQRSDVSVPVTAFGSGRSEASDLSGDYDGYYNSLVYGQWYHGYTLPASAQATTPPRSPSRVPSRSPWDFLRRLVGFRRNNFYRRNRDLYVPRLPFSHPYISQLPSAPFGFNDTGKSRGTGTYIPNMVYHFLPTVIILFKWSFFVI